MRLFYAIKLPQEFQAPLEAAQRGLRGNWRAVRPDQLHITLAFLPDVPESVSRLLISRGTKVGQQFAPFTVRLRGTGYFPNEGSPRVWFVKADGEPLAELSAALQHDLDLPFDPKPFKAHVTLARKKGPAPRVPPITFDLEWEVRSFALIHSTLHKSGPEYRTLSTFRLRGGSSEPGEQPASSDTSPPEEA
ncbi:RNA 2',3'-cyclic phosphodiesterase [Deinobacterium chartae]|nr:RNA 2',3'-cyclic phosphodiesterase [Deinobacterium chartae]